MNSLDLRDFIELLENQGELQTLQAEVDPVLEIAAVTDRVCKSQDNRALLFESVKGSSFRVVTNLFGSERRMSLALGLERLSALTGWFDTLLGTLPGTGSSEKLESLTAAPFWRAAAPEICDLPSHLYEASIDLNSLPILKAHPFDGQPDHDGRFMTLPLVITSDPEFYGINCGMYRAAVADAETLVINWSKSSGAAMHRASWDRQNKPMPVVIALGGSPCLTFSATLPLPHDLDELTFAGLLQGEPVKVFRCANGLIAPVDAEIIIEGYLVTESAGSGAFGNHTGYYTPSESAPSVKVTAIRHRKDMILPATVVGRPPMEDCWLARAGGYLLFSLLKLDIPEVVTLHQPFAGIFHGAVIVAVNNGCNRGVELIVAIRKTSWFAGSKLLVIVDAEQDPADEAGVFWKIMNSVNWERDLLISEEKLSIDATRKPLETRVPVEDDAELVAVVAKRWKEYGFED